jgi:AcrR family transcriptional regulator
LFSRKQNPYFCPDRRDWIVQGKGAKEAKEGKAGREDRRVQRTRQLLQEALVTEILEKGYEAVTVQDILDRANLGRSTFYAHYRDKEDLLLSGFEHFRSLLAVHELPQHSELVSVLGEGSDFSLALFRHVAQYRTVTKAMLGKQGGNVVLHHLRGHLLNYLRTRLGSHTAPGRKHAVPLEVVTEFLVSSLLGLLIWWIDEDLPYTPEEMDSMFKQLALPGLRATLETKRG